MQNPEIILQKIKDAYKAYYLSAFHVSSEYEYIEKMQSDLFADGHSEVTKEPLIELLPDYKKTDLRFGEPQESDSWRKIKVEDITDDPSLFTKEQFDNFCRFINLKLVQGFEIYEHQLKMLIWL